ncbi:Cytochrome P450 [Amanita muscaria]
MDNPTTLYALLSVATLLYAPSVWKALVNNYKLRSIPTVGSSGFWTSYLGALRFFRHAHSMMQEGYDKHRGSIFKVPLFSKWVIMVSGPEMINDIRSASDDYLSSPEAGRERMHVDLILGAEFHHNTHLAEVVKLPLTKNIGPKFADVQDEIVTAFNDNIKFQGNEWTTVIAYSTIMDIVCRTSNRMFVGLPLCRNPDYLQLNKQFTIDFVKTAIILDLFPSFLRSIAARLLPDIRKNIERAKKHIEPIFNDRLKQDARLGKERPDRPNDAISWLIEYLNPEQSNAQHIRSLVIHMLLMNFVSIHTTTMAFTHVLYDLATRPEYVQPMRDEVEAVIQEEGWSKNAIGKMRKLDSFVKESLRLSNSLFFAMQRKVMKDFTFSNGVTIPAGNRIAAPFEYYVDANNFDGFRFEKMRNGEGMENKHQVVSLDFNYILFGHGRHACPGRFFAANELKVMLAHVLWNYDVQMANGGGRPANRVFGQNSMPNPTAQVMFRKRV